VRPVGLPSLSTMTTRQENSSLNQKSDDDDESDDNILIDEDEDDNDDDDNDDNDTFDDDDYERFLDQVNSQQTDHHIDDDDDDDDEIGDLDQFLSQLEQTATSTQLTLDAIAGGASSVQRQSSSSTNANSNSIYVVDQSAVRAALQHNAECRAALVAQVARIDAQLARVDSKRRELNAASSRQRRASQRRMDAAVTDVRAPTDAYFVDPLGSVPRPNGDALRKRRQADSGALLLESKYHTRPWKVKDRDTLASAIRTQTRERLTVALQAEFSGRPPAHLAVFAQRLRVVAMMTNDELERSVETASLDWAAIARAFSPERRAIDCQLQWENCQSPTINRGPFTAAEDEQLRALATQFGGANWPAVAAALGTGRRAWQCFQRVQQSAQDDFKGKAWSNNEDARLSELVERFGNDWQRIASMLTARTPAQCLHRWQKSQDPTIRRAKWQPDEDVQLRIATEVYGRGNWVQIARHVHGRTDVQCRERYVNILDPDVNRVPFSADEDALLIQLATQLDHSWTKVAELMPGRTDGACWRRWQQLVPPDTLEQFRAKRQRQRTKPQRSRDSPTTRGDFRSK
jgi:hypothetical protein